VGFPLADKSALAAINRALRLVACLQLFHTPVFFSLSLVHLDDLQYDKTKVDADPNNKNEEDSLSAQRLNECLVATPAR